MATAKKGTKSNKTAHVLNLLTAPGGEKETPAAPAAPEADGLGSGAGSDFLKRSKRPIAIPVFQLCLLMI